MERMIRMEHSNVVSTDRKGRIPIAVTNHFKTNSSKELHATHFKILKSGTIYQYMDIERTAYFEPIVAGSPVPVIEDNRDVHPSLYCVSIQYEETEGGVWNHEQFAASLWLHEHIRNAIAIKYGRWFPLSRYHVIVLDNRANERDAFYEALVRIDDEYALEDMLAALESLERQGMV